MEPVQGSGYRSESRNTGAERRADDAWGGRGKKEEKKGTKKKQKRGGEK